MRPPRARREKPRVSAFINAKLDRILALQPDFVVGFSDIQADIAQSLIKSGIEVWISNHRSVDGILGYVRRLGALVGAASAPRSTRSQLEAHIERVRQAAALLPRRPRVYFEEWDEPLITGIRWVSELIGIAGGDDVFPERALCCARPRIASWATPARSSGARRTLFWAPGAASASGRISWPHERVGMRCRRCATGNCTRSNRPIILQPGPAALTDGLDAIHRVLRQWATHH